MQYIHIFDLSQVHQLLERNLCTGYQTLFYYHNEKKLGINCQSQKVESNVFGVSIVR